MSESSQDTCTEVRRSLGGLALGVLEGAEAAWAREHVAQCPRCASELAGLIAATDALALVDVDAVTSPPEPAADLLTRLLRRVASARRRRRWAGAAVAVATAAIVGVVGFALADREVEPPVAAPVTSVAGAEGGVGLEVDAWDRGWGTAVQVAVTGVPAGYRCSLDAVGSDGSRETAATWVVPDNGYAGGGAEDGSGGGALTMDGALALRSWEIERYEVVTTDGEVLVTATP
jgi:hypothetical protein